MINIKNITPTQSRKWFNTWVEDNAKGNVLDVGKSKYWDYGFTTIDVNPKLKPTIVGDICHSFILSETYDVVLCNGMYEWVSDPQKMVDEVARILKPGGIAIFGFVGSEYKPYKKDWRYYCNGDIKFRMKIIDKVNFDDYHFIVCKQNFVD